MASLGHLALGMAAGRAWAPRAQTRALAFAMVAFAIISELPDADVIGFWFGVHYADPWGHRGATHSIAWSVLMGVLALLVARPLDLPLKLGAWVAGLTLSHALLDTLTNGGLGCELLWPLSTERFFAPVRPLPVAPIAMGMLSQRGLLVLLVEFVAFLPFIIYATLPRRRTNAPGAK